METDGFPQIRLMGLTGVLVRFADRLSEGANRAALAFRAAAEAEGWPGVAETSSALASTYLRIDPLATDPRDVAERARGLLSARDWTQEPLPSGRRLWRVPTAWGGDLAPGLAEAAAVAGVSEAEAAAELASVRLRVLALGFLPGQPYLGELSERWNLPRSETLTPRVPAGALVLAVRQLTLFAAPAPTGWHHVARTAFRPFRPGDDDPMPLAPGDEMVFEAADSDRIADLLASEDPTGGAVAEPIA